MAILSEEIINKFQSDFNSKQAHFIIYGGRGKTATSFFSLKSIVTLLEEQKGSGVIMRKHTNKIRRSVYAEVKKALSRLGLREKAHYKAKVSPFEIEILQNGNKLFFTGVDNIDDIKGMVDEDRPIKFVWIEELTEFFTKSLEDGEDMLSNIEATFSRGNEDYFMMMYSFNPPRNPNHAVMRWLKKMEKRSDTILLTADYRDVPKEWLGSAFIKQAEMLKLHDEELYNNVYLGMCVGTRGRIYKIVPEHIKPEMKDFDFYTSSIDIGESKSATSFKWVGFKKINNKLHAQVIKEYHHKNADYREVDQLTFNDYAKEYARFYINNVNEYKRYPLQIRIDHDVMFAKELKKVFIENQLNWSLVKNARKFPINDRIKATKLLLALGQLTLTQNVPKTIQALKDALWNEKKADNGIDERLDDLTTDIDSLDSLEYAIEPYFNEMLKGQTR